MSQALALSFNEFTFSPIIREELPWFRSSELARALGYSDDRKVTHLYQRNADEFTENMTQVVEISDVPEMGTTGNLLNKARIFSLRGCHLIAMFARTPVAKAFRRWVLDVIEQYGERVPVQAAPALSATTASTTESRKPLTALVNVWARQSGQRHAECRAQLNAAFNLHSVTELPEAWLPDALDWVQKKIDALPGYVERQMLTTAPAAELPSMPSEDAITAQVLAVAQGIHSEFTKGMMKVCRLLEEVGQPLQKKNFAMWEITNNLAYSQIYDKAATGMLDEYSARRIAQMYCRALGAK